MKSKNKSSAPPFEPRAGMVFVENVARNPRRVQLTKRKSKIWEAESLSTQRATHIPVGRLHENKYESGWSLWKPEDALPKEWGQVNVDEGAVVKHG